MNSIDIDVPENFLELLEEQTENVICSALARMGVPLEWPRHTDEVIALCVAFGYRVDVRMLQDGLLSGEFKSPDWFGSAIAWRLNDIKRLILWLDEQQSWLLCCHPHRKSQHQLRVESEQLSQLAASVDYYQSLDFPELEQLLASSQDTEMRTKILTAIREKRSAEAVDREIEEQIAAISRERTTNA